MIFPFFKKKKLLDIKPLKVDIHSHLIPYIDDGAKSIEDSISLINALKSLGYKKLITTPHIMSDAYRNDATNIYEGLNLLKQRVIQEKIDIDIDVGAEYYLDDGFLDKIKSKGVMAINDRYVLFETSYLSKPILIEDMIFAISSEGYIPIMAHPERYRYVKDLSKEYKRFKDLGVMFQCNINSFAGYYGNDAKQKALFLSQNGMIDFLGSDLHHIKQIEVLAKVIQTDVYKAIFETNDIKNDKFF
jgi:tyrosine-protein phosphatase YwqE